MIAGAAEGLHGWGSQEAVVSGAAVISRLNWGWRILSCSLKWLLESLLCSTLAVGQSWPEISTPHHVGFFIGCLSVLMSWQLASPRVSDERKTERERKTDREPKTEATVFYNLISVVTYYHFCYILLVPEINPGTMLKGITGGHIGG